MASNGLLCSWLLAAAALRGWSAAQLYAAQPSFPQLAFFLLRRTTGCVRQQRCARQQRQLRAPYGKTTNGSVLRSSCIELLCELFFFYIRQQQLQQQVLGRTQTDAPTPACVHTCTNTSHLCTHVHASTCMRMHTPPPDLTPKAVRMLAAGGAAGAGSCPFCRNSTGTGACAGAAARR